MGWLIAAYAIVWAAIVMYAFNIQRAQNDLQRRRRNFE